MSGEKKLTQKQEKQYRTFAQEYIIKFNGTEAAIKAGYSEKTASSQASRLLTHVKVQEFIQEYIKGREERTKITGDMVIKELGKIAFSDIREIYDNTGRLLEPQELSDNAAASISSFKVTSVQIGSKENPEEKTIEEYRRYSKEKALELLGKHLGLFIDKQEIVLAGHITMLPAKDKDN